MSMGWDVVPFDVPNFRSENGQATAHVRIGWLRSVANIYHAFAVQSFANELAYAANRDPYDYLLTLIGSARTVDRWPARVRRRWRKSIPMTSDACATLPNWPPRKRTGARRNPATEAAWALPCIAASSLMSRRSLKSRSTTRGPIRIPHVYTAVDAGIVANPEMVRPQFEGAAVFGTSIARTGEITATDGAVDQSNFFDYPVARMNDAPRQVDVHIVESTAPPAGVGEPGVPPFVPALCNAVFAATGKRVRELPLTRNGFS